MNWFRTTLFCCFVLICCTQVFAQFAGGSGTDADPYLIQTATQLDSVRYFLSASFKQIADIDLDVAPYNLGTGWVPIGLYNSAVFYFTGKYYGNGYTIRNLYIDRPDSDYQGLFGYVTQGFIDNLRITDINIRARSCVGGLIGYGERTSLNRCYTMGTIRCSGDYVGGLIGQARSYSSLNNFVFIDSCISNTDVYGHDWIGGLVGFNLQTPISFCHTSGNIFGHYNTGGLIGHTGDYSYYLAKITYCHSNANVTGTSTCTGGLIGSARMNSLIQYCYSNGNVSGFNELGGLIGHIDDSYVADCFSTADVSGNHDIGGLVGVHCEGSHINNSYSTGHVTGSEFYAGGFVGWFAWEKGYDALNCYWNMETSGMAVSDGCEEGRTTDAMTWPYAANTYVGWDFDNIWISDVSHSINNGYPYLLNIFTTLNDDENAPMTNLVTMDIFPNPLTTTANIRFVLLKDTRVSVTIYNILGQKISSLSNDNYAKGPHIVQWNGRDDNDNTIPNGIYICKLAGKDFQVARKVTILK